MNITEVRPQLSSLCKGARSEGQRTPIEIQGIPVAAIVSPEDYEALYRLDLERRHQDGECTGIAAQWCPVCGTCTCSSESRAQHEYDDPECPLHREGSEHATTTTGGADEGSP